MVVLRAASDTAGSNGPPWVAPSPVRVASTRLEIDPGLGALPLVWVNANRIEQVFANLVVSATRYAPGSSIHISGAVADAGGSVQLWLEDGGPGNSADDLPRILDNLYRGR